MLHDYHLYLAPGYVRERLPGTTIQHFTHIPWPDPRYWQLIPAFMHRAIHANLCAANVLGFQPAQDVRNFLHCCEAFLEAEVDYRPTSWGRPVGFPSRRSTRTTTRRPSPRCGTMTCCWSTPSSVA
ncbi:MAG: hypothetical protein EXR43_05660 [Dehalococcoidia bacterium]|nr:hypothetical protein [Dehalococcoidia bacterium]